MKLADVEYESACGAQKVASDLVIVFSDGSSMWRCEYAGLEGWDFAEPFSPPEHTKPIFRLVVSPEQIGWMTLEELNKSFPHARG